jgi:hypothetical protein
MQRGHIVGGCFAIDTWKGDQQAGFYDDTVFQNLSCFIQSRYGAFAELVRLSFDEALSCFNEGSIDFLHIDGLHTYEAVKSDFENWLPKLSDRAVVLFHDTNVRQDDFGVWKLWDDIRQRYPSFEFLHGHGLGVAAVGKNVPTPIAKLVEMEESMRYVIQDRFAQLGARWMAADSADLAALQVKNLSQHIVKLEAEGENNAKGLATANLQISNLIEQNANLSQHVVNLEAERENNAKVLTESPLHIAHLESELERSALLAAALETKLSAMYWSTSWRLTKPLRAVKISWQTFIKALRDISRTPHPPDA